MSARRAIALLLAVSAAAAGAVTGARAAEEDAPVLRLPAFDRCLRGNTLHLTIAPREDDPLAALTVRVGSREVLQLADLSGPGRLQVRLPRGGGVVAATATSESGEYVEARERYRRCRPRPPVTDDLPPARRPEPPTPPASGGGGT